MSKVVYVNIFIFPLLISFENIITFLKREEEKRKEREKQLQHKKKKTEAREKKKGRTAKGDEFS